MVQRPAAQPDRLSLALFEPRIREIAPGLGRAVHTHTARVPYGSDVAGAVTDPAALAAQRTPARFVASTTIDGPNQLAVDATGNAIGLAMVLGDDRGLPGGKTLLDLALGHDVPGLIRAGLQRDTAEALCTAACGLRARAPDDGPLSDQPILFFEAGREEVAVTPLVSVRVLQQINARLADADASTRNRVVLPIAQGGANPQNVAHYVNSSPRRGGETLVNRNARRGQYSALRVRCPLGLRSRTERDLARVVATGSLASVCQVSRDAVAVAQSFLAPLREVRAFLADAGKHRGYALNRLSPAACAWLAGRIVDATLAPLVAELAENLVSKVEQAARGTLPPAGREALRTAMLDALGDAA